jgi:hypothetical protein
LLRALRFTKIPGHTIAQACERYGVSPSAYRRAHKKHRAEIDRSWSIDDWVLAALLRGPCTDLGALASWLDYVDHSAYSTDELRIILGRLEDEKLVKRDGETYHLAAEWP